MSQVDNSAAGKRARTDGGRRDDDWTCPSCGNVNYSFRTTCNMRNCSQSRTTNNNNDNAKAGAKSVQAPPTYTSAAYMGSGAPSSMYLGAPPYGSSLFSGSPLFPYDLQFSGGSGLKYDYGNCPSVSSPFGPPHMSGLPPYSGGSMLGTGGMYSMPPFMDQYGMGMPMRPGVMGPGPGPYPDENSQKKNAGVGRESDWTCPNCGNKNYSFRTVCNMKKCNTPRPATQDSKSEISISSKPKIPDGSWKCEKCNNINYPFRTKCNRQNCGAERPAETNKTAGVAPEDDQGLEQFGYVSQCDSPKVLADEHLETGHKDRITATSSALDANCSCSEPADRQVMSWLLNSIHHSLNQSLLFLNNAKVMWNKIEKISNRNHEAQVFQLREEIRLCKQGEMSFIEYYASLCKLWEELMFYRPISSCCPKGVLEQRKRTEEDRIFDLLSGLNSKYSYIREQILSHATLPSLHDVYSMLLNEEHPEKDQEFLVHPSVTHSGWLSPDSESQSQIPGCCTRECAFCGDSSVSGGSKEQKCAVCGRFGHLKDTCWHLFWQSTRCLLTNAKSRIAEGSDSAKDSSVSIKTDESSPFRGDTQIGDIESKLQQLSCL